MLVSVFPCLFADAKRVNFIKQLGVRSEDENTSTDMMCNKLNMTQCVSKYVS